MSKESLRRKDQVAARKTRRRRAVVVITLLLLCAVGMTLLAQVTSQRRNKKGDDVSIMSLSAASPSKEYVYAGPKKVATIQPTAFNGNDAQFVSMQYKETCTNTTNGGASWLSIYIGSFGDPGAYYEVKITMMNTGSTTWSPGNYYLGSQNLAGNNTWGLTQVPLTTSVSHGNTIVFDFNVKKPVVGNGLLNFQWQMLMPNGVGYFGERTNNVGIFAGGALCDSAPSDFATFVSQSVPSSMLAGRTYPVSVTMANAGSTTWTSVGNYKLSSQVPQDNTYWGINRVSLPSSVAPATNAVFAFNAVAPTTTGNYNFEWEMTQDGGIGPFGMLTPPVAIAVTSKAALGYLDYNNDDKTDLAVWRPSTKQWLIDTNLNGTVDNTYTFGQTTSDIPVPGDYNGDGKADLATIKLSSLSWSFDFDRNGTADQTLTFGSSGDIPVPQDYNGDKQTDIAVFRPSTGQWIIDTDRNGVADITVSFGQSGDIPVPADYNGDGKADLAVFRPSTGQWIIDTNQDGVADMTVSFGQNGDIPLAADFNGDGRADLVLFRTGQWLIDTDRNGTADMTVTLGQSGDVPAPGDYNGDGIVDIAVFRPSTNKWLIDTNRDGTADYTLSLGASGDIPLRQNGWILKAMGILPQ